MIVWPYNGKDNQRFYVNSDNTISPVCNKSLVIGRFQTEGNLQAVLIKSSTQKQLKPSKLEIC